MQKIILVFTFIIGILIGILPFEYNTIIQENYVIGNMFLGVLTAILSLLFSISIHELAHFVYFVKNGVKMRLFCIFIFVWINDGTS